MSDEGYTYKDYREYIDTIAESVLADYPNDEEAQQEHVTESVDSSAWIIYWHANQDVLDHSDNEPDGDEVRAMAGDDADWRKMRQIAAFMALETDCMIRLQELRDEEAEEADDA